jgi:hypothetical protein
MTQMEQPTDVQDVRVVHFGLGPLGAAIAQAVASRDGLVSVAAIDPLTARAGADLGDVAGLGSTVGVTVASEPSALRDLEADVVLFVPESDFDSSTTDLELLLELGLNVVMISPELAYPSEEDDELAISIDTLAREAEVTALALDLSDALLGSLPLMLTSVCSRVDRITVRRRGDIGPSGRLALANWAQAFAVSIGWPLDDVDEEDTGAAHGVVGTVEGRDVLLIEVLAESAGSGPTFEVEIEGVPSLRLAVSGDGSANQALAALAVNAIPAALTSEPGLYTLAELPPVHYWTSLGLMPADDDDDDLDDDL